MKKLITLLCGLFTLFNLYAQDELSCTDTIQNKFKVKVFMNFEDKSPSTQTLELLPDNHAPIRYTYDIFHRLQFNWVSIALEYNNQIKKYSHEIDILPLTINTLDYPYWDNVDKKYKTGEVKNIYSSIQYQINWHVTRCRKLSPYLGLYSKISYKQLETKNIELEDIAFNSKYILLDFGPAACAEFTIVDKLLFDVNVPINIFGFYMGSENGTDMTETRQFHMFQGGLKFKIGATFLL